MRGHLTLAGLVTAALLVAAPPTISAEEGLHNSRMLVRINVHRLRFGLVPLTIDSRLAAAARAHAADMATRDYFSHNGPDGSGFQQRITRAGYRWRVVAENLAAGLASPEATVDSWMTSPGHRKNLLNPAFRHAGIGHVFRQPDTGAVRYGHYWTLTLGTLLQ